LGGGGKLPSQTQKKENKARGLRVTGKDRGRKKVGELETEGERGEGGGRGRGMGSKGEKKGIRRDNDEDGRVG